MPSLLRREESFDAVDAQATYQTSQTVPPAKKQKMSLTQTYYVASTARTKLGREAGRSDHNLRRLVGHANLLDTLMVELADAEREQEAWFNDSVKGASKPQAPSHLQWFDTVEEEDEDDSSDDESDDGSSVYDEDDEDDEAADYYVPLRKLRSPPVEFSSIEVDEDYESDEDDMEMEPLTRVSSRHSPPELTHDDSDSDEEPMPPSPENATLEYSDKERQAITTTTFFDHQSHQQLEELFPQQPQALAIAAC